MNWGVSQPGERRVVCEEVQYTVSVLSRMLGFPISFMDENLLNGELKLVISSAFPTLSNMLDDILFRDMVVKTSKLILSFYAVCNGIGLGCPGLDNRASMFLLCIYNPQLQFFTHRSKCLTSGFYFWFNLRLISILLSDCLWVCPIRLLSLSVTELMGIDCLVVYLFQHLSLAFLHCISSLSNEQKSICLQLDMILYIVYLYSLVQL